MPRLTHKMVLDGIDEACERAKDRLARYAQTMPEAAFKRSLAAATAEHNAELDEEAAKPCGCGDSACETCNPPKTVEQGTILYSCWGYEQTNIDYYVCVRRTKCFAWVAKIAQTRTEDGPRDMTGSCVPKDPVEQIGPVRKRKVRSGYRGDEVVNWCSYADLYVWDGRPKSWSSYA